MRFLSDWQPLAPLRDEEIYGAGVAIKEEEDFERDLSNVIEDSNDALSAAPFVAEDFGPKGSSDEDQAAHREGHEDLPQRKSEKRKCVVCEVCCKKFRYKSKLTTHMRVHTKEKPYSCDVCEKAFSWKKDLVNHMRVHTKEKPYRCEFCEKTSSRKSDLATMHLLSDWLHLAPLRDEEIYGAGVAIKKQNIE
ncbi:zinc finger protein 271-like [Penaeus japonicus]|uniref:zinc finger protein 271-like n=1 Tax=Penaeus japonicus TaxID=27405 RepID=UPI001C70C293|nr:zinc finger protein 271-like [Penaeus japonicus]